MPRIQYKKDLIKTVNSFKKDCNKSGTADKPAKSYGRVGNVLFHSVRDGRVSPNWIAGNLGVLLHSFRLEHHCLAAISSLPCRAMFKGG